MASNELAIASQSCNNVLTYVQIQIRGIHLNNDPNFLEHVFQIDQLESNTKVFLQDLSPLYKYQTFGHQVWTEIYKVHFLQNFQVHSLFGILFFVL